MPRLVLCVTISVEHAQELKINGRGTVILWPVSSTVCTPADNEWESDEDEMDDDESGSDDEAGEGDKKKEGHGGASKKVGVREQ